MKCVVQSTQAVYKKENAPPSQAEALENIIPPKKKLLAMFCQMPAIICSPSKGWFQRQYQSPFCLYLFF